MVEHVACLGEQTDTNRVMVGKPALGHKRRWEDNIKKDVEQEGWGNGGD